MDREKLAERKKKAESMGIDTILKYHKSYIGICKTLGMCNDWNNIRTDIALIMTEGIKKIYGKDYTEREKAFEDVIWYYIGKKDLRAIDIIIHSILERVNKIGK